MHVYFKVLNGYKEQMSNNRGLTFNQTDTDEAWSQRLMAIIAVRAHGVCRLKRLIGGGHPTWSRRLIKRQALKIVGTASGSAG